MRVHDYVIRMVISECNISSEKLNALVELTDDMGDLLPYLNTVFGNGQYSHQEKILTAKRGGRLITFRPRQIAITKPDGEDEAKRVTEDLMRIIPRPKPTGNASSEHFFQDTAGPSRSLQAPARQELRRMR